MALGIFSFDSDVVGLLCGEDEPYNLFDPAINGVVNRPMIGIITKIDEPNANVPMVRRWLEEAGCGYSKGTVRIPYSDHMPLDLVTEIAAWNRDSGDHP